MAATHARKLAVSNQGLRVLLRIMEQCGCNGTAEPIFKEIRSVSDELANYAISHAVKHNRDREVVEIIVGVCRCVRTFLDLAIPAHASYAIRECFASEHFTSEHRIEMQARYKTSETQILGDRKHGKQSGPCIRNVLSERQFER